MNSVPCHLFDLLSISAPGMLYIYIYTYKEYLGGFEVAPSACRISAFSFCGVLFVCLCVVK